jgi:hypothetical protein
LQVPLGRKGLLHIPRRRGRDRRKTSARSRQEVAAKSRRWPILPPSSFVRIGMDCQKLGTKTGDLRARPAHPGRNIVQLKIQENLFPVFNKSWAKGRAPPRASSRAIYKNSRSRRRAYHSLGSLDCRNIEHDDKFIGQWASVAGVGRPRSSQMARHIDAIPLARVVQSGVRP